MKKRFTFLIAALMLLFIAPPLAGWGQTVVTFTPGTDTGATSVTKGDITATMTTMNNPEYYQIYANQSGTFSTSNGNITKIEFTCTASGKNKYGPGNASANVGSYSYSEYNGTWTGSASSITISSTVQVRMSSLVITYTPAAPAYTITAQSNNTSYGTVSLSGSVITGSPNSGYRYADPAYTVSPANSATVAQNGNAFTVTPSANTTVTINFEAIPCYAVTLGDDNSTLTEQTGGAGVTLPSRNGIAGYSFAGWSPTNVSSETTTAPETIIPAGTYYPTANITLYPVYTRTESGGGTTDVPVSTTIASYASANSWVSGTRYTTIVMDENVTISGKDNGNNSKYYSTSPGTWRHYAGDGGEITVSTTSGTLKDVTITYTGNTLTYGSNNATSESPISVTGTSAVFAVSGTSSNTQVSAIAVTYTISGSSTTYYWSSPVAAAVETPVITVAANPFLFSTTATITCATDGANIKYSYDGETWNDYSTALTITETKTIYAKGIKGSDESSVAQVTATKNLAEPTVTINASGITNTNVYTGTAAGSLAASVTYNDAAIDGASVTWSGNNDAVATINANTGAITLVAAGSVTFTATYAGDDDYSEKTATYEMIVTNEDPNALTIWSEDFSGYSANDVPSGGTYSYACVNGGSDTKIYSESLAGGSSPELLVGKNSGSFTAIIPLDKYAGSLKLTYKTNAKSMTISTTTTGLSISGTASYSTSGTHEVVFTGVTATTASITIVFTPGSDNVRLDNIELKGSMAAPQFSVPAGSITAGSTVTLSATAGATIYYTLDGSTPTTSSTVFSETITISENKTINAIAVKNGKSSAVGTATYTIVTEPFITLSANLVEATKEETNGTINVSYNNLTGYVAEINWYESDGKTNATYDWLEAEINSSTKHIDYTIAENETYSPRTAYMKVYALGEEGDAESELITITQVGKDIDYATLPFIWDNNIKPTGVTLSNIGYYTGSPYLKLNYDGESFVILKLNEAPGAIVFDIKGNPSSGTASTGTFKVMISDQC